MEGFILPEKITFTFISFIFAQRVFVLTYKILIANVFFKRLKIFTMKGFNLILFTFYEIKQQH